MRIPTGVDWRTWRIVHAGLGTLVEVDREWTIADVESAHAILDAFDAARIEAEEG